MAEDVQEKVLKYFASKHGYLPGRAKQLKDFVNVVFRFTQYVGANKYYSDTLNRRLALLSVDVDLLSLKAEALRIRGEEFYDMAAVAILSKKEPKVDAKDMAAFHGELDDVWKEARAVHGRLVELMTDIKKEYAQTK